MPNRQIQPDASYPLEKVQPQKKLRLLVVGTLPPPICGTTVSLQHLLDSLSQSPDVNFDIIDTGSIRRGGVGGIFKFFLVLKQMFSLARRVDVITLHLNPTAIHILCPFAFACRFIFGPRVVLRLFGGEDVTEFKGLHAWLFRWSIRRCDLYLAQTKAMVESNKSRKIEHVKWFPTSRPLNPAINSSSPQSKCRKFVSVGWVSKSKGVPIAIEAGERFGSEISLDFYGPFNEGMSEHDFEGLKRSKYQGIIPAGKATSVLREYDALLFPTHWKGEGYPGIILEAFQAGLPIITTSWRSIPELVDDECGLLVPIKNVDAVENAMKRLINDDALFDSLRNGAIRKGRDFSAQYWNSVFIEYCRALVT